MPPVLLADLRSTSEKLESLLKRIWVSVKAWRGAAKKRRNPSYGRNECFRPPWLMRALQEHWEEGSLQITHYSPKEFIAWCFLSLLVTPLELLFLVALAEIMSSIADCASIMAKFKVKGTLLRWGSPRFCCLLQINCRETGNEMRKRHVGVVLENELPEQMPVGVEGKNQQKLLIFLSAQSGVVG